VSIEFDFSELNTLAADIGAVPDAVIPQVRQAVEITARHIKDDAQAYAAKGPISARSYSRSIDYEMELDTDSEISAQIGPNLGKYGRLTRSIGRKPVRGGIAAAFGFVEEGGARVAPQRNLQRAERDNLADFERGILKATEAGDL